MVLAVEKMGSCRIGLPKSWEPDTACRYVVNCRLPTPGTLVRKVAYPLSSARYKTLNKHTKLPAIFVCAPTLRTLIWPGLQSNWDNIHILLHPPHHKSCTSKQATASYSPIPLTNNSDVPAWLQVWWLTFHTWPCQFQEFESPVSPPRFFLFSPFFWWNLRGNLGGSPGGIFMGLAVFSLHLASQSHGRPWSGW